MGIAPGIRDKRISAILLAIIKPKDLSYWGMIKHFQKHPKGLKWCELTGAYSGSTYRRWIASMDAEVQQKIILWLASDDAVRWWPIPADSA